MNEESIILAIIYIALFLGIWYPFGSWYNRKLIKKYFKIIKNTFVNSELKKIGSGGLLISGSKMNSFKIYGIVVTPISRENPINWFISYLANRRDLMIFKGNLNKVPNYSIEIINSKIGASKGIIKTIPKSWFRDSIDNFIIYSDRFIVPANVKNLLRNMINDSIWRISITNKEPNITMIISLENINEKTLKNIIEKIELLISSQS